MDIWRGKREKVSIRGRERRGWGRWFLRLISLHNDNFVLPFSMKREREMVSREGNSLLFMPPSSSSPSSWSLLDCSPVFNIIISEWNASRNETAIDSLALCLQYSLCIFLPCDDHHTWSLHSKEREKRSEGGNERRGCCRLIKWSRLLCYDFLFSWSRSITLMIIVTKKNPEPESVRNIRAGLRKSWRAGRKLQMLWHIIQSGCKVWIDITS